VGNVQLASVGANVVFKIAVGVGRQLWLANQGHGHIIDHAQVLKVFQGLVGEFAVKGWGCSHADVEQQQGMTVWVGACHLGRANGAAGTRHVFDHKVATW